MKCLGGALLALLGSTLGVSSADAALVCYKAKDAEAKATYGADVSGLAEASGCRIKAPGKLLCVDSEVAATDGSMTFPDRPGGDGGPVLCYPLKCPKGVLPPVAWSDPIGSRAVRPGAPAFVCSASAPPSNAWTTLVSRSWTLTPGFESYQCRTSQVDSDMFITGLREIAPAGTYEMVLTVSDTAAQVGDYDCSAASTTLGATALYAAGFGTDDLVFPQGVAEHVKAGQFLNLTLHLLDAGGTSLSGTSGVQVQTGAPVDADHEAEMTFAGTLSISLPSDAFPHIAQGGCNATADSHVFAVWPHMRALGRHSQLVQTHAGLPTVLLDAPYVLDHEPVYPVPPTLIPQGDQIQAICYYVNDTGQTVVFGDTSQNEECFVGVYHYPPTAFSVPGPDTTYSCVN